MNNRDFLLIICSLGAIQSFFWTVYFLFIHKNKSWAERLLAMLFLVLGIRILKSTLFLFTGDLSIYIINLGFAAHLCIGPLLWLYLKQLRYKKPPTPLEILHFLPAALVLGFAGVLRLSTFWYEGGYYALLFHAIIYLALVCFIFIRHKDEIDQRKQRWAAYLVSGVGILLLAYFSNYVLGITSYLYGPLIYAGIVYWLSFYLTSYFNEIFLTGEKYSNINVAAERVVMYKSKIVQAFEENHSFLKKGYTLTQLSLETNIPKHILSHLFNNLIGKSFPDFVNAHRIETSKKMLVEKQHRTIASIAYDCGFNSLSSFNKAFKKFSNTTPSKFRKN